MQDSIWFHTLPSELRDVLQTSDELPGRAEVVIVGSGMIGISTAYYLTEAGVQDICLVDRGTALGEASGANAGGLWFAQQSSEPGSLSVLAKASSHLYDELSQVFEFDFTTTGLLELLNNAEQAGQGESRAQAVRDSGFRAELVSGKQARSIEPGLALTPEAALFYPDEAHVHPTRLAACLAVIVDEVDAVDAARRAADEQPADRCIDDVVVTHDRLLSRVEGPSVRETDLANSPIRAAATDAARQRRFDTSEREVNAAAHDI